MQGTGRGETNLNGKTGKHMLPYFQQPDWRKMTKMAGKSPDYQTNPIEAQRQGYGGDAGDSAPDIYRLLQSEG